MLDLPFSDECFDVVIEKGTMVNLKFTMTLFQPVFIYSCLFTSFSWFLKDVLFVDSGDPWNPRPETVNKAMAMLQGVHRVLKPDGVFISISFGQVKHTNLSKVFSIKLVRFLVSYDSHLLIL